ncbi:hypothetical protein BJ122_102274 [Rhodopseudomonas faecalis]|uniref:Uncharacterized protein n=1 Tax=Rhodopseudomonas faecalis TaxID=99655 RepID=A0A318TPW4_9BRAD|nr:hypothetical protein [Rhodopseudomonas faecalis]PYF05048.1 hypothetical protein BJ122_102274 [Rhodopseudomonas faecalis]
MASQTAQLILQLVDRLSGPAANAAKNLGGVEKALQGIGKQSNGIRGWGSSFQAELDKLKLAPAQLAKVRAEWEKLQRALTGPTPLKASVQLGAMSEWQRNMLSHLRSVRREADSTGTSIAKATKLAGAAFAASGGVYGLGRVGRNAARNASTNMREGARDYLAGVDPQVSAALAARALQLSGKYSSVDMATMHAQLREAGTSMRDFGKAMDLSETIAKGLVVLQSLKGKEQAVEENQRFFRALDTLGKNQDPAQIARYYDAYIRALGWEGAELNMGSLFEVAKMSKSAGPGLSERFLMAIAPGLMGDMTPMRFGTALGSTLAQVIGDRATKRAKAEQERYGLRDAKGWKDQQLIMSDPFRYSLEKLIPALQKRGVNTDDPIEVAKVLNKIFSNQIVADLFTKMITQRQQYQDKEKAYEGAPGLKAAKELPAKDPFVAWEGFMASMRNFASVVGDPIMGVAATNLERLAGVINSISSYLSAKPEQAAAVGGGLLAGGAAAAAYAASKAAGIAKSLFGGAAGGEIAIGEAAAGAGVGRWLMRLLGPLGWYFGMTGEANGGEVPFYKRDGNGNVVPNTEHPALKGGARPDGSASVWEGGANPIQGLTGQEGRAAAIGQNVGASFTQAINSELDRAEALIRARVQAMVGTLSFTASPKIAPQFAPAPAGAAGGSAEARRTAGYYGAHSDYDKGAAR